MRLGMYCNYTEHTAEFASRVGFESMEIAVWPNSTMNVSISDNALTKILKDLEKRNIEISALGFYPNFLSPDTAFANEQREYMFKVIELASRAGVKTIGTHAGCNYLKSVEDNIPEWKEVFCRFCEAAAKHGIRIAIENCPMIDGKTLHRNNIAYSPEIWEAMFEAVPAENLGLEFDPAHMVWLGINYVKAIHAFGHKIFHVHAKDLEMRPEYGETYGIWGPQIGNHERHWRGRAAGWGDVDWHKFITALVEVGYTGNVDIEHEDRVFFNTVKAKVVLREEQDMINNFSADETGLMLGFNTLRPLIPPMQQ